MTNKAKSIDSHLSETDAKLFRAAITNDVILFEEGLAEGGNVNASDSDDYTPLISAVMNHSVEMVVTLLQHPEIDVSHRENLCGMTAEEIAGDYDDPLDLVKMAFDKNSREHHASMVQWKTRILKEERWRPEDNDHIIPKNWLEEAIMRKSTREVMECIIEGDRLTRKDTILHENLYKSVYPETIKLLFAMGTEDDLLHESFCAIILRRRFNKFPENHYFHAASGLLLAAVKMNNNTSKAKDSPALVSAMREYDTKKIVDLIFKKRQKLKTASEIMKPYFAGLENSAILAILTAGLGNMVIQQAFKGIVDIMNDESMGDKDYDNLQMIANLMIRIMAGTITWEKNRADSAWYPFDPEKDYNKAYYDDFGYIFDPRHRNKPKYL